MRLEDISVKDFTEEFKVIKKFDIEGEVSDIRPFGNGHINRTFLITTDKGRYVLQEINSNVFKKPREVMENIINVTEYLKSVNEETLNFRRTLDGDILQKFDGGYFRVYDMVEDTITYDTVENADVFKSAGAAFGNFQNKLSGFDASVLHETISRFHDTPNRYENFKKAVEGNIKDRLKDCEKEVAFVNDRADTFAKITEGIADGSVPLRVTHNDTKLNNILIDENTKKARVVIDLDTIMPGSMLYDFGDAIRFGASTAAEDEKDIDKVHFDKELFRAYADGFCNAVGSRMTEKEKELLPYSAYLMTMECGMRFLTDFLEGDTYFGTAYPTHNLVRCRTQFRLAKEMQEQKDEMLKIVYEVCGK